MGESVYLITGNDKEKRIITQISYFPSGRRYELSCGLETSWHYAIEFSREKGKIIKVKGLGNHE